MVYLLLAGVITALLVLAGIPFMLSRDPRRMFIGCLLCLPYTVFMTYWVLVR